MASSQVWFWKQGEIMVPSKSENRRICQNLKTLKDWLGLPLQPPAQPRCFLGCYTLQIAAVYGLNGLQGVCRLVSLRISLFLFEFVEVLLQAVPSDAKQSRQDRVGIYFEFWYGLMMFEWKSSRPFGWPWASASQLGKAQIRARTPRAWQLSETWGE